MESQRVEELLVHSEWLRSLARSLVADAHQADDLSQETWIAALRHQRPVGTPVRRWLAAILRNRARQEQRSAGRRHDREIRAARGEALDATSQVAETLSVQRKLLAAVEGLDEPYRSTIYLRFYEGLAPRLIAQRRGIPVKTVKTQLARGIEQLRRRLDRDCGGDRRVWLAALAPLALAPSAPSPLLEGLLMAASHKLGTAAAVAVLALCGIFAWRLRAPAHSSEPNDPGKELEASATLDEPSDAGASELVDDAGSTREAVDATSVASEPLPSPAPPLRLRGRVIDVEGRAVPGIDVWITARGGDPTEEMRTSSPSARTDAQGFFDVDAPSDASVARAEGERWTTLLAAYLFGKDFFCVPEIVVAPRMELAGRVVNESGAPVPFAVLACETDWRLRVDIGAALWTSFEVRPQTTADADGFFRWWEAPGCIANLYVHAAGHEPLRQLFPAESSEDMSIVLRSTGEEVVHVLGRIVDENDAPVSGAFVALGSGASHSTTSSSEGSFRFSLSADELRSTEEPSPDASFANATTLVACVPGYRPVRSKLPPLDRLRARAIQEVVILKLGARARSLQGRVVDAEGRPVSHAEVWIAHGEEFVAEDPGLGRPLSTSIEAVLAGLALHGPSPAWSTDEAGRFELLGLLDRGYELYALDVETGRSAHTMVEQESRDVEIVLDSAGTSQRVKGRVVDPSGAPVHGLTLPVGSDPSSDMGPNSHHPITTGQDGTFEFGVLDGHRFEIVVVSQFFSRFRQTFQDANEPLAIIVGRDCPVRVVLDGDPARANSFGALDEAGASLVAHWSEGAFGFEGMRYPIHQGRSEVFPVDERARVIVLMKGEVEIARAAIRPSVERITTVRF